MLRINSGQHIWQFSRVGGVNRVNLERGADLEHLGELDQKLWTALSCPVDGLEIDSATLKLFDTDHDGKIRVPEIIEAVRWLLSVIYEPDDLLKRPTSMPLSVINKDNPEGAVLLASARQILIHLDKPHATELSIADTSDTQAIFAGTGFNGDGVITAISTDDPGLQEWITRIISSCGAVTDRSGLDGISAEILDTFLAECEAYAAWHQKAQDNQAGILPFAAATEEAYALFLALRSKIDDYFLRCQLAEFDPASAELLNNLAARIEGINHKDISASLDELETFPIARIAAGKAISFKEPLNPAWRSRAARFFELIRSARLVTSDKLTEEGWKKVSESFDPFQSWMAEKAGVSVEPLGIELIREYLHNGIDGTLRELLDKDMALETEAGNILLVDKLVRYYCDIYTLLNNFVSFSDFYSPDFRGIFQAGTLYFDQRSCDLCIRVSDMVKHNLMAASSGICLVYFNCISRVKDKQMVIVAAFTDGDVDNLELGRNAVFYDNNGLDWDASIIKIIDNPISIRQAFWSPYRKISKMIGNQVKKIAASQEDKVTSAAASSVDQAGTTVDKGINQAVQQPAGVPAKPVEAPKPAPFDIGKFAGIFAAVGLAFAAIGSVLTSIIGGFMKLAWWKMPLALIGVMLLISGPSMFLAWLKLRKRNLAPVLDANGWAVNARAVINIPFGGTLTHLARLPKNARLNLKDPFRKKRNPWIPVFFALAIVIALLFLLRYLGFVHFSLPWF
ncbi:MAG TPA: hypothetical protein P5228_09805 [Bacteroidales bacterium]|nr:hypothetical protein [Bacteroidales bacterium]